MTHWQISDGSTPPQAEEPGEEEAPAAAPLGRLTPRFFARDSGPGRLELPPVPDRDDREILFETVRQVRLPRDEEAYERHRAMIERRFGAPRPAAARPRVPVERRVRRANRWLAGGSAAAAVACLVGGTLLGLGMARTSGADIPTPSAIAALAGQLWTGLTAAAPAPSAPPPAEAAASTAAAKTHATTRLVVADAAGSAGEAIRLTLGAEAPAETPVLLVLEGIPEDARLTAGRRQADGTWHVSPDQAAGIGLILPDSRAPGPLRLSVAAVEQASGLLAAPVSGLTVEVAPAAAAPVPAANFAGPTDGDERLRPTRSLSELLAVPDDLAVAGAATGGESVARAQPAPAAQVPADAVRLVAEADRLMELGDLAAARELLVAADRLGAPGAAWRIGRTYDPVAYEALAVVGPEPDPRRALEWYRKAEAAGDAEAGPAIAALIAWANR